MNLIDHTTQGLLPLQGDLTNQILVIRWELLHRRYQLPRFQLIKAKGGFGCREDSSGKIFGVCIADASSIAGRRADFIGIATTDLINRAMADTTPVPNIDLSLREYMLVARDGSTERGDSIEQARQRLKLITSAAIIHAYQVHPESRMTEFGFISYPDGAPPTEVKIRKGNTWTAQH